MNNLLKCSGLRGKTSQRKAFYQMTDVLFQLLHDFSLQEHKAVSTLSLLRQKYMVLALSTRSTSISVQRI